MTTTFSGSVDVSVDGKQFYTMVSKFEASDNPGRIIDQTVSHLAGREWVLVTNGADQPYALRSRAIISIHPLDSGYPSVREQ